MGAGLALVLNSGSSAVAGLPANYRQQDSGATAQLLIAIPGGAKITADKYK
jgi:hypothetical protein